MRLNNRKSSTFNLLSFPNVSAEFLADLESQSLIPLKGTPVLFRHSQADGAEAQSLDLPKGAIHENIPEPLSLVRWMHSDLGNNCGAVRNAATDKKSGRCSLPIQPNK